jgi:hypothetical protein
MANTRFREIGFRLHMANGDHSARRKISTRVQSSLKPLDAIRQLPPPCTVPTPGLPSLKRYERNTGTANQLVRERLQSMSLNFPQKQTGLSRNTILRARLGERVHPRSLQRLLIAARSKRTVVTVWTSR